MEQEIVGRKKNEQNGEEKEITEQILSISLK